MHVAQEETHICPFEHVEKISKCHLTEREGTSVSTGEGELGRARFVGVRWQGGGLGQCRERESMCMGEEGASKGGYEAWRTACCIKTGI